MSYELEFTDVAIEDIKVLKKTDSKAFSKVEKLLLELMEHPLEGTGKPEPLKYTLKGLYSRRINKKHRLIYQINNEKITVLIVSVMGDYGDK